MDGCGCGCGCGAGELGSVGAPAERGAVGRSGVAGGGVVRPDGAGGKGVASAGAVLMGAPRGERRRAGTAGAEAGARWTTGGVAGDCAG